MDNINKDTFKRGGAFLIDFYIVQGIAMGVVSALTTFGHYTIDMKDFKTLMIMFIIISIWGGLYALFCKRFYGRTLGKGILNRVIVDNNNQELDYAHTFSRETSKWMLLSVSPAAYILICVAFQFFGKKTPHDLLAKTDVVVREK